MTRSTNWTKTVALFFIPGMIPLVSLVLFYFFFSKDLPSILVFLVVELFITLPLFFVIMTRSEEKTFSLKSIGEIIGPQKELPAKHYLVITVSTLAWAALAFVALNEFTTEIRCIFFHWVPDWFDLGDYLLNKDQYAPFYPKLIWMVMIVASIAFPLAEEVYFRGYLLKRTNHLGVWSPVLNTVLFALYHVWSLWMVPVRIIAVFPLYFFVWKKNNIYLGVIVHCSLNLIGDVILTYTLIW